MKKLATLLVALVPYCLSAQNIWVADNNPNAPTGSHIFSTVQEAVNAASAGDIVQVQPSPYTYGNATIDKQITLVGIGFNLTKDLPLQSSMGDITLTNNADNTSDADGTIIKGLTLGILYVGANNGPSYTLENVTVYNCKINYVYSSTSYYPVDNFEIYNCYIFNSSNGIIFYKKVTNTLIRNNLIIGSIELRSSSAGTSNIITNNILYDGIYVVADGTYTQIVNNIFVGQPGTESGFKSKLTHCIVGNNIFYGSTPSIGASGSTSTNFQLNTFDYNLVYSTGDDTMPPTGGGVGNSGANNIVSSPDFLNVQLLNSWSSSYDFTLDSSVPSPAIDAGSDGTDMGITGGLHAWTDTNLILDPTAVPTIETLNTSTIINPGDDLPAHVKAKSN